ncbi:MAG: hypothetical protein CAPSK01_004248 [Candidatus Accumulibacter vicinus]|uniref:Uncharacterized protein n=1 Tax=Candidatus Accumulibacter vicinus TaxID=2954382 RepID=A0A084XV65_9PROT|nr:MAG: hypothetical protein CAPSK01_004248 [Candidatus Accumulibacter vicinus]
MARLIGVRPQRCLNDRLQRRKNAIIIRIADLQQGRADFIGQSPGACLVCYRRKERFEQVDQRPRNPEMRRQTALHIGLAERQTGLPQVTAVGAQDADLPPVETRQQDQAVETVVLCLVAKQALEQVDEGLPGRFVIQCCSLRQAHCKVGNVQVTPGQTERLFGEYRQSHVLKDRQNRRQRSRPATTEQLQVLV